MPDILWDYQPEISADPPFWLYELNRELNQKTMNATVNVVCYTSKILSNGEHPLMLRICKDGKKKYRSPVAFLM